MTRIEALRQIVATNKAAKLDGHVVDTFTAARLLESYKALDGAGRRRFASMSVDKMVTLASKLSYDQKHVVDEIFSTLKLTMSAVKRCVESGSITGRDYSIIGDGIKVATGYYEQLDKPME